MTAVVTVLAGVGFIICVASTVVYLPRMLRRPSQYGYTLAGLWLALGAAFGLRVLALRQLSLPEWVWALAYLGIDLALAGLLWLLIKTKEE